MFIRCSIGQDLGQGMPRTLSVLRLVWGLSGVSKAAEVVLAGPEPPTGTLTHRFGSDAGSWLEPLLGCWSDTSCGLSVVSACGRAWASSKRGGWVPRVSAWHLHPWTASGISSVLYQWRLS